METTHLRASSTIILPPDYPFDKAVQIFQPPFDDLISVRQPDQSAVLT